MVVYDLEKERAKKLPKDILELANKVIQLREEAEKITAYAQAKVQELLDTKEELINLVKKAEEHQVKGDIIKQVFQDRKDK